jgi:predicted nucleotidyltransferase component of viral defense system
MIERSEIQRRAASLGVDPVVIDHDYAISCVLHGLAQHPDVRQHWIFKGGTSLAKCYFSVYRFSEDLDFTLTSKLSVHQIREILEETRKLVQQGTGLRMDARQASVDPSKDAFGMEGLEGRLYYQGIWVFRGDARAIRFHVDWDEAILFGPKNKPLSHPYSDAGAISSRSILTYSLEETVMEKLRAFSGQRRYAIARDVFDLHFLNKQTFDKDKVFALFPNKCEVKGLRADDVDLPTILKRKEKYALNWRTNLEYLVPNELRVEFDEAWNTAVGLVKEARNLR